MARVVLIGNLAQLTGGVAEFRISATSVKHLFQQLAELDHTDTGRTARLAHGGHRVADAARFQDRTLFRRREQRMYELHVGAE